MGVHEREIPVGVLFSRTGSYSVIGNEGYFGARIAIEDINASGSFDFRLRCIDVNPDGSAERYADLADHLLRNEGCRHIVGCQTSWSRKEVLPVLERHRSLLWYTTTYEGFESHDRVVYTGACPNQNVIPLFQHVVPNYGNRAFLVGSNYIWGWEINRIARELLAGYDGTVLGERYIPLGDEEITHLIAEIREKRPDFVLNNLIGNSSYAFLRAYAALALEDPFFHPSNCPVLSCNLTEAELSIIGPAAEGLISTATYFETLEGARNDAFVSRMRALRGEAVPVSAMFVGPYVATWSLAAAIKACGTADPDVVLEALPDLALTNPLGSVSIDRRTQHTVLTPYVGVVEQAGRGGRARFKVLEKDVKALAPDPYLVDFNPQQPALAEPHSHAPVPYDATPRFRVVK